jgi:hypothetical protein
LTLVSAVLCVATAVLWFTQPHVTIRDQPVQRNPGWDGRTAYGVHGGRFFVGQYWRSHDGSIYDYLAADAWAPCWLVSACTAALPAAWVVGRIRSAAAENDYRPYTCRGCGYDCRATPGRCPECGWEANGV